MSVKQVIVIRKDLKMRRGKEIAQGSHASIAWLVDRIKDRTPNMGPSDFTDEEEAWMMGSFTKVCVQVDSEEELREIHQRALAYGLTSSLITDSGRTEFHGEPTPTCCAIGPNLSEEIDRVTGELRLY